MNIDNIIVSKVWHSVIKYLTPEDRLALYDAIFAYGFDGEATPLTPIQEMAFKFIKPYLDKQEEAYKATCERNRANGAKAHANKKATRTESDPVAPSRTESDIIKENKREENKIKENKKCVSDNTHAHAQSAVFSSFISWMEKNAPTVHAMERPFTEDQLSELMQTRDADHIKEVILQMENKSLKNYKSAYTTFKTFEEKMTRKPSGAKGTTLSYEEVCEMCSRKGWTITEHFQRLANGRWQGIN